MRKWLFLMVVSLMIGVLFNQKNACAYQVTTFKDGNVLVKQFEFGTNNVYLIQYNHQWLMIDSSYPEEGPMIVKSLRTEGINISDIKYLILTHSHSDHSGNAKFFQEEYGIKVIAGAKDIKTLQKGQNDYICPTSWFAQLILSFGSGKFPSFTPDILVQKELNLELYGFTGKINNYTSHTPGSLVIRMGKFLFVGDLIRGGIFARRTPMLHFVMCDLHANYRELKELLKNSTTLWLTGHFGPLQAKAVNEYIMSNKSDYYP